MEQAQNDLDWIFTDRSKSDYFFFSSVEILLCRTLESIHSDKDEGLFLPRGHSISFPHSMDFIDHVPPIVMNRHVDRRGNAVEEDSSSLSLFRVIHSTTIPDPSSELWKSFGTFSCHVSFSGSIRQVPFHLVMSLIAP